MAAPLDGGAHVHPRQRVEQRHPVVHALAVVDHRALHRQHVLRLGEAHRLAVLLHQIGRGEQVDVVEALQRAQAAPLAPHRSDVIVRGGIEPAFRLDVHHVGGAPAVLEESAHPGGKETVVVAEDLLELLEGADAHRLLPRPLQRHAEEGRDAGLHRLERDVPVASRFDVDAR